MKIAMIGLKGLPGIHGGVERHVEELAARLAERGESVTAYVRPHYTPSPTPVRGIALRLLPTVHSKHLDATIHTLLSCVDASLRRFDIVHIHGIGPALFAWIPRIAGRTVIVTMHSRDYLRGKWGAFARLALHAGELAARTFAHRLICVSREMADAHSGSSFIPNGVSDPMPRPAGETLARWGLAPGEYLLYVGRISPEKGPHHLLRAFREIDTPMRLALVGGASHGEPFENEVARLAADDPRVVMTGYVDTEALAELYTHACAFVLPSEHEGLPVAMLEAMSYGVPVVATDIPAAREVATDGEGRVLARFAEAATPPAIRDALADFLRDSETARELAKRGAQHVLRHYRWGAIADATLESYREARTGLTAAQHAMPCPLCGAAEKTREYDGTRSGRVARCAACAMVFSVSPPPVEALPPAFTDSPGAYLANARDRLGRFEATLPGHGRRSLDVGCYDGRFAGAAKQLGYDVRGVEPVASAAARAEAEFGFSVTVGTLESAAIPRGAFDVVSFIHVFEHLADPRAALAVCRRVLAPGGALLIEIPAYDALARRIAGRRWRQFISDHDRFYTGAVLARLLREEGFDVLRDEKVGKVVTPNLLADRIGRYYSRALGGAIRSVSGALDVAERTFTIRMGDIRLVVAKLRSDE
ncbi:MAG: glycosyltransferase [Deltaproteobacteria bacterium]|nr:glycosyltransferase [Deltaproteobacteria bacterium]